MFDFSNEIVILYLNMIDVKIPTTVNAISVVLHPYLFERSEITVKENLMYNEHIYSIHAYRNHRLVVNFKHNNQK